MSGRTRRSSRGAGRALAVTVALLAAACGGADAGPDAAPTSPASTTPVAPSESADPSATAAPSPSPAVVDAEHAVDPPGPLEDRLYAADLLIFNEDPLEPGMVRRIKRIKGIAAVEVMGLANVTIENRAINVAAVDPATYRRFTPANSAQLQEAWDRVAGGELAITPRLGRRLEDEDGLVRLGADKDAPTVHIGAYAPQATQVDVVLNEKWAEELGMELGNAVLLSTDEVAPDAVRKPLQRIVGEDASVQRLDVVARFGLDTSVQQTAVLTGGSVAQVIGTFNYRVLGGGRIAPEPSWVASHIESRVMPIIGPMTCNKAMFPQLEAALREVVERGLADELNPGEYAGCYYPRFIAGTTKLSNHSFGTAMDFNVPGNQRGTVGEMDRTVVAIFKKWGFAWGGDWKYTDPMHFEMNAVVSPR
ncbi:M15 family metallopeptidase [Nocardioides sp. GCM10027113]|uniref:M15 family metallopeptidase n=1 Tax=unclassified Nocardioides TaxID=2615069 RepID=UPI00360A39FB